MRQLPIGLFVAALVVTTAGCSAPASPPAPAGPALFYAKDGVLYVSDPAGTPGRKITDGPDDTQPAPSPDGKRVAYLHNADPGGLGGELWVLDVDGSTPPRRLVDPAALVPNDEGEPGRVETPQWSPAGDRVAFLKSTYGGGGFLLTADAATGAVQAPRQPLFANQSYAWSPDGRQLAWAGGRSDVSPVDVNVWTVGESSTPVVVDTNASSVDFDAERRSVLFTNGDAGGPAFADIPFQVRAGGVYSFRPPEVPTPLFAGTGFYADVHALPGGVVAFTEWSQDQSTKTILTVGADKVKHTVGQTPADAEPPVWTGQNTVAYVDAVAGWPLLVKTGDDTKQVDTGVDAFAWAGR